jgi:phasin family protein
MADESDISKAEKAYADAAAKIRSAESTGLKATPDAKKGQPGPATPVTVAPVEKAPAAAPKQSVQENASVAEKPKAKPAPAIAAPRKAIARKKPAVKKASVLKAAPEAKPATGRTSASKPAAGTGAKPIPFVSKKRTATVATPTASITTTTNAQVSEPTLTELKEKIMATANKKSPDFSTIVTDIKDKAKAAYEKGSSIASEVGEFTKGNLDAMVESGKIFASGAQELGRDYVEESKSAFETITADMKKIAAVKSPTEFFQLQGELARRNFDAAIAFSSKSSEKIVKLSNETLAPISNRVSIAVEKISKAA